MTKKRRLDKKTNRLKNSGKITGVLALFISIIIIISMRHTVASAFVLATTHQPEKFSILSFDHVANLPLYVKANQLQHFAYRITNYEAVSMPYHVLITMKYQGQESTLENKYIFIKDGSFSDNTASFKIAAANKAALITVQLVGLNQSISFRSQS